MENKTELSKLGEFGLIDHLTKNIKLRHAQTVKGVGDDAAVLRYGKKCQVVTTDLLMEGIHFNLMYSPLKHLGYKAVVVNLSDVYAMNAIPKQITVSIAISNKYTLEAVEELYEGIYLACDKYQVDFVGGDTSSSLTGMAISITALGEADPDKVVYRSGAKKNDLICVTGDLGAAYLGLQLLEREKEVFKTNPKVQPDLSGYEYILERQLKPEAQKALIESLDKAGIVPGSMIDISDGLSSELLHICKNSNAGCKIFEDKIPVNPQTAKMANEFHMEPLVAALNGGEDYEMLFTVPLEMHEAISKIENVTQIGHITNKEDGAFLIPVNGNPVELKARGWNAVE